MKKILNSIVAMICVTGLFTACETKYDSPILDSTNVTRPKIMSALPSAVVITSDNLDGEYATVKYTPAAYSTPVPITNQVQIALSNAFPADNTTTLGAATPEDSIVITNKALNSAVVTVGGITLTPNTAWLRIKSAVNATTSSPESGLVAYSDPVQVTITPYEPQPAWIYVPGAHQGWDPGSAPALCSLTDNGIYVGYIKFDAADVEFKFTGQRDWNPLNWGSGDGSTLVAGGGNIKSLSGGWYKITVNLNTLSFTQELFGNLGVVGTINNWTPPDVPMTYNDAKHRFEATITCAGNDAIKFRLNEEWGTSWGGKDGVLSGDNIAIADAGTYLVTVDFLTNEYTITKQ